MITEAQLTLQCVRWQSYIISPIMACSGTASLKTNIKAITGDICHRQRCSSNRSDLCSNALLEMWTSSVMGHYTKCVSMNCYEFFRFNASSSRHICDDQVSACDCCMTQIKRYTVAVPIHTMFGIRDPIHLWDKKCKISVKLLCHPDLNSPIPRLSGSSLRLLRQFGGGISEGNR